MDRAPLVLAAAGHEARSILFVDDEPHSCKWFARAFGNEFTIVTADSVTAALEVLSRRGNEFAVLMTDYRMPERDGMKLLRTVQRDYRHLVRLLATAYAEKDVAIAAVNDAKVLRILEKPLDDTLTREALREALELYRVRAMERSLNEGRVGALRETLGFLAHELNTPLATVRGYVASVAERMIPRQPNDPPGEVRFSEHESGEIMTALAGAERRALYCQSLVSTFVQSARDAYPGSAAPSVSASSLVASLLDEFPFDDHERSWASSTLVEDFELPGRRDLLYLVLCTLTKNALHFLRGQTDPHLSIEIGREPSGRPWIRFADNGPGIAAELLPRLTREPITTRASTGGNGMGLMFCNRVMQSLGGEITIASPQGEGAQITLYFKATPKEL